jgi:acyl dehydratase
LPGLFLEDFDVGMTFETPRRTVTEADVVAFAGTSGDYNPLHTDEEFAKNGPFGRRIGHGVLTLAILTGLWDRLGFLTGSVEAFYGIDKLRFTRPVFFGDSLRATVKVVDKKERETNGMIVFSNEVVNQRGETVLVCDTKVIVRKKPAVAGGTEGVASDGDGGAVIASVRPMTSGLVRCARAVRDSMLLDPPLGSSRPHEFLKSLWGSTPPAQRFTTLGGLFRWSWAQS